ncbi:uncharacterized protein N7498_003587 [Penicillium cinerascens]|uniref:Uncharacterized protein n=1 Tax=Penicillium cinerascens TaxID=70096 RepID=A0A9W9T799_9EURO|nr:uncharacterized protein N7498_003587 [Penicillium cinerascens]KAJ5211941.1 hypothetical protein N7498_003587 [Penicillium cinerascens]
MNLVEVKVKAKAMVAVPVGLWIPCPAPVAAKECCCEKNSHALLAVSGAVVRISSFGAVHLQDTEIGYVVVNKQYPPEREGSAKPLILYDLSGTVVSVRPLGDLLWAIRVRDLVAKAIELLVPEEEQVAVTKVEDE